MEPRTRKRKSPAAYEGGGSSSSFPFDDLNQDLLERVLSWLPPSSFFRTSSVCKRWKSVAASATFKLACSQVPTRDPWFFMVHNSQHQQLQNHPIVFDSSENKWLNLNIQLQNQPPLFTQNHQNSFIPVAASGGLICFHSAPGEFILCNPVTGVSRQLPSPNTTSQELESLRAISMVSSTPKSCKLVLVFGELSELSFKVYDSRTDHWGDDIILQRKIHLHPAVESSIDSDDDQSVYFLSKCGNVVAADIQRSPAKQYSSVFTTSKDGEEIMYFLSSTGTVVGCNLTRRWFSEYPRLLPPFTEYSIDLVECGGEMLVVILSEFLETAGLRVWKFDEKIQSWRQIGAMPPSMSHELYGKKVDINCSGAGRQLLICMSSGEFSGCVLCDLAANEWVELPNCYSINGRPYDFTCAFSFEPRIEASV